LMFFYYDLKLCLAISAKTYIPGEPSRSEFRRSFAALSERSLSRNRRDSRQIGLSPCSLGII
jgi:hypothetical protein